MRWTIRLVVTVETAKYVESAIRSLRDCGFGAEDVEIVSKRGVSLRVEELKDIISKKKLRKEELEGCTSPGVESKLFANSLIGYSGSFINNTDMVLVTTPGLTFWSQLREFLEATVEPRYVAVYFPHTPSRFFMEFDRPIPTRSHGWFKFDCDEPVAGARCFCMNKHTAFLFGALIRESLSTSEGDWKTTPWDYLFFKTVVRAEADCYAAGVSFVHSIDDQVEAERSINMRARLKTGFAQRNWYIN